MLEPMETTLTEFEIEWENRCLPIASSELDQKKARNTMYDFDIAANVLRSEGSPFEFEEVEFNKRIENLRFKVDDALNKAQTNFKNGESVRLKIERSGFSGIFDLKSIFGFFRK